MQPRQIGDGKFCIGAGNVKFCLLLADVGIGDRNLIARLLQLANGRRDVGAPASASSNRRPFASTKRWRMPVPASGVQVKSVIP